MNLHEQDFPELRAGMRESVLGTTALAVLAAVRVAWSEAVVTRLVDSRVDAIRRMPSALLVQSIAIVLGTAALAAWAMSLGIPDYLGTSIPSWAFFFCALMCGLAAAWPEAFAHQWSRSLLRRVSYLFRRR